MFDLESLREMFGSLLMQVGLSAFLLIACAGAIGKLVRVVDGPLGELWRRSRGVFAALAMLALCTTLNADKTNEMMRSIHRFVMRGQPSLSVSEVEISNGYRVDVVTTNSDPFAALPSNAVEYARWSMRGGFAADFALDLGGFVFPMGTNRVSRFDVLSGGAVEPLPRGTSAAICAAREYASLVPGVSRFWSADADDGAKVLRWDRVFANRDSTGEYTAEMRFFQNGDFTTRSNEVETAYRRVNPDDWDDDGIANERDLNPLLCDGDFYGVANALPSNANLNAYYWLDLSVTGLLDCATIRVTCDGPSDLGDHVIIALTNQVCHIPLLAGATYAVESDLPVGYSEVSSEYAEIATNSATSLTVFLPLELSFERVQTRGGSDNYIAHTSPIDMGPRILNLTGGCCSCVANDVGFTWRCLPQCHCAGVEHPLSGDATWEGYLQGFNWFGRCHCYYEDQVAIDEIEGRGVILDILDARGDVIQWKHPILVGDSITVEVTVGGDDMSVADFVLLFGGRIKLTAYNIDTDVEHNIAVAAIPISTANVTLEGHNIFSVAVGANWLQSSSIVRNAEDNIIAKTSIDMSGLESGESNRHDSDLFDAGVSGRLYGRVRGDGNSHASIPECEMNLKTLQSSGTATIVASAGNVRSIVKQCQQQADIVYYSCHGSHATGEIADMHHNRYSCDSVTDKWRDVDVVVIAGCSVLDVGSFRAESFGTSTMVKRWWAAGGNASPGEKWETKGAKVYLGYAWTAPTDENGGNAIAASFIQELATGKDWIEAWRIANDCDAGRNACAIDCRNETHVFWYWQEANGIATWTSKRKKGSKWE